MASDWLPLDSVQMLEWPPSALMRGQGSVALGGAVPQGWVSAECPLPPSRSRPGSSKAECVLPAPAPRLPAVAVFTTLFVWLPRPPVSSRGPRRVLVLSSDPCAWAPGTVLKEVLEELAEPQGGAGAHPRVWLGGTAARGVDVWGWSLVRHGKHPPLCTFDAFSGEAASMRVTSLLPAGVSGVGQERLGCQHLFFCENVL